MATVADLLRRSLQLIGVVAEGEALTASQQTDAFETLNEMLDTWAAEGLGVSTFAATTETVDLAPGYAKAIRYALAAELAPEYGVAIPGEVASGAAEAKYLIKRTEHVPDYMTCDPATLNPTFDVVSGDE